MFFWEEKVVDARASSLSGADDNTDSAFLPDSGTEGARRTGAQAKAEPGDLTGPTPPQERLRKERGGEQHCGRFWGSGRCPLSWPHTAPGERA